MTNNLPDILIELPSNDVEENHTLLLKTAGEIDTLDLDIITKAYRICVESHEGQKRKNGDPFYTHPLMTALYYLQLFNKHDTASVTAALLHDSIEDSENREKKAEEIRSGFGDEVFSLVNGLTNIRGAVHNEALSFGKLMIEMIKDHRVMLIKLCDRLHNMQTLSFFKEKKKRREISKETLKFFVPIAQWIGKWDMKRILEDIAFSYINQKKYDSIKKTMEKRRLLFTGYIEDLQSEIKQVLKYYKIDINEITVTHKTPYEIYLLSEREKKPVDKIDNFYSMVVSLKSNDKVVCYHVLGILYEYFMPIDFVDYISYPKFNLFQSLLIHVLNNDGRKIEVLIRTDEMDEIANNGFLAVFDKTQMNKFYMSQEEIDQLNKLLLKLIDTHGEKSTKEIRKMVENNFYHQEIHVLNNDLQYRLPLNATILDLVFMIDDKKAMYFKNAKINNKKKPYFYKLADKEVVEVNYSKTPQAKKEWSKNVVLFKAILAIDKFFEN